MEARKLVVQVAAVCPFAMVLGMGATVRHATTAHSTLQYSDAQNQRIEAYSPLMTRASWSSAKSQTVERYAKLWVAEGKGGNLEALPPAFQEDLEEDNPRSQILQTWTYLVEHLGTVMRSNLRAHNTSAATLDAAQIIRVSEILRYSDFDALRTATDATQRAITTLTPHLKQADRDSRFELVTAIRDSRRARSKLPAMYKIFQANYEDYLFRRIGFGQQAGEESSKAEVGPNNSDDPESGLSPQEIERRYVHAIRAETSLKAVEAKALSLAKS